MTTRGTAGPVNKDYLDEHEPNPVVKVIVQTLYLPECFIEDSSVGHAVEEGPEGGVAAPVVVQLVVPRAQVHRHHLGQTQVISHIHTVCPRSLVHF